MSKVNKPPISLSLLIRRQEKVESSFSDTDIFKLTYLEVPFRDSLVNSWLWDVGSGKIMEERKKVDSLYTFTELPEVIQHQDSGSKCKKPEDWDDEEDGEWTVPRIINKFF
ncbi:hypothetical protein L1887_02933 [Cichorium endivia]|nr:hypothetical protein L1887_02933 [Cichorium endivia]